MSTLLWSYIGWTLHLRFVRRCQVECVDSSVVMVTDRDNQLWSVTPDVVEKEYEVGVPCLLREHHHDVTLRRRDGTSKNLSRHDDTGRRQPLADLPRSVCDKSGLEKIMMLFE